MAFNLPNVPFKLSPEDMGVPDLTSAIANGLKLGYLPQQLPADLMLKQAEANSKNAFAGLMLPQMLLKVMGNKEAFESLPIQTQQLMQNIAGNLSVAGQNSNQQQNTTLDQSIANHMNNNYSYDNNGNNIKASPQQVNEIANQDQNTPAQRTAQYEETVNTGKGYGLESGKTRAKQIAEMDDQVFKSTDLLSTLGEANNIVGSPIMKTLRDTPEMGKYQINYLSKFGTPQQQEAIGNLKNIMGNIVVDFAGRFKGTFRKGEQGLVSEMKINDSDTIDGMIGKLESMNYLVQLGHDRNQLASKLMRQHPGMDRSSALESAQNSINGEDIKQKINEKLHPNNVYVQAQQKGYTQKMSRINPQTNQKETALVHPDDVEEAQKQGWSNV